MDKGAVQYLVEECRRTEEIIIGGRSYTTRQVVPVADPTADTLQAGSLAALVKYLKEDVDGRLGESGIMLHVKSPTRVVAIGPEFGDFRQRDTFFVADCDDIMPNFQKYFGAWVNNEAFQIWLRTGFVDANQRGEIAEICAGVTMAATKEVNDDGVKQQVTVQNGIKMLGRKTVPNPVLLAPFRTFLEVPQPASEFLFRVNEDGHFMLKEADGGAWRLAAMKAVHDHLEAALKEAGLDGKIIVIS